MEITNSRRREIADKMRAAMGALGAVEIDGIPLADLIEPEECDGCEPGAWEVVAMETAERLGVAVGGCLPSDYADAIGEALDRRLMPEGMEWPRFEDGEQVSIGDLFAEHGGCENVVYSVEVGDFWFKIHGFDGAAPRYGKRAFVERPAPKALDADDVETRVGDKVWSTSGAFDGARTVSRVVCDDDEFPPYVMFEERREPLSCLCCCLTHQRPAPKVLDADGAEIRVGDAVYGIEDGTRYEVCEVGLPRVTVEYWRAGIFAHGSIAPSLLTHRAPVFAADGKPLREWEMVWSVNTGEQLTVTGFDGDYVKCRYDGMAAGIPEHGSWHAHELTHEPLDSWERLEEDVDAIAESELNGEGSINAMNAYCTRRGLDEGTTFVLVVQDLVRRAKELAERG